MLALRACGTGPGNDVVGALLAVPAARSRWVILAACRWTKTFANIYSTATSVQNIAPRADRQLLALDVGRIATVLALAVDGGAYEPFLFLIEAVFDAARRPAAGRLRTVARGVRHPAADAPRSGGCWCHGRPGFVAYQLTAPTIWRSGPAGRASGGTRRTCSASPRPNGFSASIVALLVAGVLTPLARGRRTVRA